ncbi:hypothetical protein [Actinoplanes sp. NPDC051859]|uniref:hypothetical protein n=1 Tax=Actinoplanes sp. NPDC051859 TaxID=3363909 RepID=UPI0037A7DE29
MTTQTPYGPPSAEPPQFVAGHAPLPPGEFSTSATPQFGIPQEPGYAPTAYGSPAQVAPDYAHQTYAPAGYAQAGYAQPGSSQPGHAQTAYAQTEYVQPAVAAQPQVAGPEMASQVPSGLPDRRPAAVAEQQLVAAAHPTMQHPPAYAPPGELAAPMYPQEGAVGYPQPVAYAQPAVLESPAGPDWSPQATAGYAEVLHPGEGADAAAYPVEAATAAYPPSAYPTAPPWASGAAAAPVADQPRSQAAVVAPYGVVPQVGGLLVPYPEELKKAPHAQAPAVWPVLIFTLFFNVLGVISAARRAGQAQRGRNKTAPYWLVFAATFAVSSVFWLVIGASVAVPVYLNIREGATVTALEEQVLNDGQLAKANVKATEADCRAAGEWISGHRDFLCQLKLEDGRTGQVLVTSDDQGNWRPLEDK